MNPINTIQIEINQNEQNQSVENKSAKDLPDFDSNEKSKVVTVEDMSDKDYQNHRDTIFEEERKFQNLPTQPRNQGDFLQSGFCGKSFLFDLTRNLYRTYQKAKKYVTTSLPLKEVPFLGKNDDSDKDADLLLERLLKINKNILKVSASRIFFVILWIFKLELICAIICVILMVLTKFLNSILLNEIINNLTFYATLKQNDLEIPDKNEHLWKIYGYFAIVVVSTYIYTFCTHQSARFSYQLVVKMRTQFLSIIYKKISQMSAFQIQTANIGKLVNLASNDFNMIEYKIYPVVQFFCCWIAVLIGALILVQRFGPWGLIAMVVIIVGILVQMVLSSFYGKFAMSRSHYNDQRIKLCNDVIDGIRLIKMYTWELEFVKAIKVIRNKELMQSFFLFTLQYGCSAINQITGLVAVLVLMAILEQTEDKDKLTLGHIISTIDLVQFLRFIFKISSVGMIGYKECINIMRRSRNILAMEPITQKAINQESDYQVQKQNFDQNQERNQNIYASLKDYSSFWAIYPDSQQKQEQFIKDQKAVLKNINFTAEKSQLTAILGRVGSGKSTFLQSFLYEIPAIKGFKYQKGKIAYVEQEPYIFDGTVRDNIILGKEFVKSKYEYVVKNCCLITDFEELIDADQTEIGEKGVNLSGGQKARISLARAVYQDADLYLLDDPLSAVDAKVGKLLYKNVIQKCLKEKCVILCTHQIHFVQGADQILILEDGNLIASGTYPEIQDKVLEMAGQINKAALSKKSSAQVQMIQDPKQEQYKAKVFNKDQKKLIQNNENTEKINVKLESYWIYLKNSQQWINFLIVCGQFSFDMVIFLEVLDEFNDYHQKNYHDKNYSLKKISVLLAMYLGTQMLKYINMAQIHLVSVKYYQVNLIRALFRGKPTFFDQTPSGSIINRFSNDTGLTDVPMFQYFIDFFECMIFVLAMLVKMGIINAYMFIPMAIEIIVIVTFYFMTKEVISQARVLDIRNKGPVYQFFSTTLGGILPLKIYEQIDTFKSIYKNLVDNSERTSFFFWFLSIGFGFIAQMLSTTIGVAIMLCMLLLATESTQDPLDVGLIIIYVNSIQDMTQWSVRQLINFEIAMASLERIEQFTKQIPPEKEYLKKDEQQLDHDRKFCTKGSIEFKNVVFKYRPDTDPVLKNLSFKVQPGEKVGCVGRTGAGKSSLLQALFRMCEIENFDDKQNTGIYIDDQRIQDYGLKLVRNSMSIIPQIPFVFSGTIRRNLDPQEEFSDAKIYETLKEINLYEMVTNLEKGIYTDMSNVATVFSIGQKQLICLGRTILKHSHIVVLDEATANVDMQTDDFIQKTIKNKFSTSTIFTIAHRLNTIADYDKILVMDKGKLAQFDHPYKLLTLQDGDTEITNEQSIFAQMVKNTGKQNSKLILQQAKQAYFQKKKID